MKQEVEEKIQSPHYIQDIESKVFQAITYQVLKEIASIELVEGSILDSFLGVEGAEKIKAIHVELDETNPFVSFKIDLNILYGVSIPEKSEEIQNKVKVKVEELTGYQIGFIHLVFKNIVFPQSLDSMIEKASQVDLSEGNIQDLAT